MGHDHHFLSRLDRVSREHVELALTLYRDDGLLRAVLDGARVAQGVDRVAISLADPERGPFLVVTRDGHFVTCLGEGMTPGALPVVTRARFDGIAHRVEALRARVERARQLAEDGGETVKLLRRIHTAGDDLTREEFVGIAAFQPLLGMEFLKLLFRAGDDLDAARRVVLAQVEQVRARDHAVLRAYWATFWAVGHLAVLVGMGGARELIESLPPEVMDVRRTFAWSAVRQGITALALRGIWAVGRIGKPMLAALKDEYVQARTPTRLAHAGLGLMAVGLGHARLRAEVRKALDRPRVAPVEGYDEVMGAMGRAMAAAMDMPEVRIEGTDMSEIVVRRAGARLCVAALRERAPGAASRYERAEEVPADFARALATSWPLDFLNSNEALAQLLLMVPWAVRAAPEEFYLTREQHARVRTAWTPEHTLALLAPIRRYYGKRRPVTAEPSPGRNDPCSCGSGKKYKKCCGR